MTRRRLDSRRRVAATVLTVTVIAVATACSTTPGHGTSGAPTHLTSSQLSPAGSPLPDSAASTTISPSAPNGATTNSISAAQPPASTSPASSSSSQQAPFNPITVTGTTSGGGRTDVFYLPKGSYAATIELQNKCRYMLTLVGTGYNHKMLETAYPVASPPLEEHVLIDPVAAGLYYIDSATNAPAEYCPYSVYIQ